ncbi:MAG: hypothetical protein NTV01_16435 [Bacteroidia bacterium]|nr:hypothetical protein [Bacteroidia bacterium]
MKNFFVLAIVLSILSPSCKPKISNLVTCDLSRTDYSEVITATGTIQPVNALSIMAPRDYYGSLTVGWVKPEGSHVEPGDSICVMKCPEILQMFEDQKRNLETLKADFKRLEADNALNMAVLEARLKENQAGMSISQLDSIQMKFAPPVKKKLMQLELEKLRVQEKKLQKKYLAEKTIDETEIRQMKSRIIQAENQVQSIQEKVKGLTLYASNAGILTASEAAGRIMVDFGDGNETELGGYPKPGSTIWSELPLMSLPDLTQMQVKLEVQEVDYKRIEKGQKVTMTVDAANGLKTTGSVKMKAMASKMKYISATAKFKYYEVVVSVDSCHTRMPPGLSARCTIMINQVRDTVVVPSMAIFEKDSMKIVYVAEGDKFRPVPVETGLSNSSQTIISKGLAGKETIALVEPSQNYIEKKK